MAQTSLIMPAYNAAGYLERSVRSVLNQTERDLRLFVVDDGSTDGTAALLDRLAAEDRRIVPIHAKNAGPALARNLALERLGEDTEYVMFLDADDVLLPDALEYALRGARDGADVTVFGFTIVGEDGSTRDYCEPEQHLNADTLGASLGRLYKANLLNQVWGKLFSARLLRDNGIRFEDYRWGEDRLFVFDCLEKSDSVCVLPECKYRYEMHGGESLITSFYERKFQVCRLIDRRAQALCRRFGVEDDADFRYMFLKSVFSCLTMLDAPGCPLDAAGKREAVRTIVTDEQVLGRSRGAFGGLPVQLLAAVLRTGSLPLNRAAFSLVALAGRVSPGLVRLIKHRK